MEVAAGLLVLRSPFALEARRKTYQLWCWPSFWMVICGCASSPTIDG
jgi:hypothetical protein